MGLPTDDTQLTFWTLEALLESGGLVPERLADKFRSGRIFGMGRTVREFLRNYKESGFPWYEAGPESAGNGALMRISSIILPHLKSPSPGLWADTVLAAMMTHNDWASNATCVAWVNLLWGALAISKAPERGWWLKTFCEVAGPLAGDCPYKGRGGIAADYEGPFTAFVEEAVGGALARDISTLEACNSWFSGAYLLETVPSVLYILEKHADDPEEAIIRAINDTRDNDTVAAIVGARPRGAPWQRRIARGLEREPAWTYARG